MIHFLVAILDYNLFLQPLPIFLSQVKFSWEELPRLFQWRINIRAVPAGAQADSLVYRVDISNFEILSFKQVLRLALRLGKRYHLHLNIDLMKLTILVFLCSIFAVSISYAQEFDYSFKESYEVTTPAQLDLSSFDGNLDVIPTDGNKILVYYIVKKGGKLLKIDRQELEKDLIVESEHSKNGVKVSVRQ